MLAEFFKVAIGWVLGLGQCNVCGIIKTQKIPNIFQISNGNWHGNVFTLVGAVNFIFYNLSDKSESVVSTTSSKFSNCAELKLCKSLDLKTVQDVP